MLIFSPFSLLFCIVYCRENRLKSNITPYGKNYLITEIKFKSGGLHFWEVLYHWEIIGWTSCFLETWSVDAFEMTCRHSISAKDQTLLHADSEHWSDYVATQADLSLWRVHMLFCSFAVPLLSYVYAPAN